LIAGPAAIYYYDNNKFWTKVMSEKYYSMLIKPSPHITVFYSAEMNSSLKSKTG
jgi:hypothetical protein